jgi:hypothetical protein
MFDSGRLERRGAPEEPSISLQKLDRRGTPTGIFIDGLRDGR